MGSFLVLFRALARLPRLARRKSSADSRRPPLPYHCPLPLPLPLALWVVVVVVQRGFFSRGSGSPGKMAEGSASLKKTPSRRCPRRQHHHNRRYRRRRRPVPHFPLQAGEAMTMMKTMTFGVVEAWDRGHGMWVGRRSWSVRGRRLRRQRPLLRPRPRHAPPPPPPPQLPPPPPLLEPVLVAGGVPLGGFDAPEWRQFPLPPSNRSRQQGCVE